MPENFLPEPQVCKLKKLRKNPLCIEHKAMQVLADCNIVRHVCNFAEPHARSDDNLPLRDDMRSGMLEPLARNVLFYYNPAVLFDVRARYPWDVPVPVFRVLCGRGSPADIAGT